MRLVEEEQAILQTYDYNSTVSKCPKNNRHSARCRQIIIFMIIHRQLRLCTVLFINTVDVKFSLNLFEKLKADGKSQKPY